MFNGEVIVYPFEGEHEYQTLLNITANDSMLVLRDKHSDERLGWLIDSPAGREIADLINRQFEESRYNDMYPISVYMEGGDHDGEAFCLLVDESVDNEDLQALALRCAQERYGSEIFDVIVTVPIDVIRYDTEGA